MKHIIAIAAALCICLTGCVLRKKETYTDYVQAVLDCCYFDITDKYIQLVAATPEAAQEAYEAQAEYVAWIICDYKGVDFDCISDETYYDYIDLAKRVMEKASFYVQPAVKSGKAYNVTVSVDQMDFMDITFDAVEALLDDYSDRYAAFDGMADDELMENEAYLALSDEYGQRVLDVLYSYVDQIGYYAPAESVVVEIIVDADGYYGISDRNWISIDELILGVDNLYG